MVHEPDLVAAESALGVVLPQDYRDFLMSSDGMTESMPGAYIDLWSIGEVVRVSRGDPYGLAEQVPGAAADRERRRRRTSGARPPVVPGASGPG